MDGGKCPQCGAPLAPGAVFCTYCGTNLQGGGSPPLASSAPAMPPPLGYSPQGAYPPPQFMAPMAPAPPHRRSRLLVVVVILVVVILVVAVIAVVFLATPPPPVQVSDILIWAPDNVCGLNTYGIYFLGFNGSKAATQTIDFGVPNYNTTACTIVGVITNSTGFSIPSSQVPLTIAGSASVNNPSTASMNITITSPNATFSGYLNLVFR